MAALTSKQRNCVRLLDGYVFRTIFGNRPDLCQTLLETVLNKRMDTVTIVHHEFTRPIPELAGGRVDLLAMDEHNHRYDVEIRVVSDFFRHDWVELHQALVDVNFPIEDFEIYDQRDCLVIFICDFDPYDRGQSLYEYSYTCLETGEALGDGHHAIVLNTRGSDDKLSPQLNAFLHFAAGEEDVEDPFVSSIRDAMDALVSGAEWLSSYVLFQEERQSTRACALRKGYEDGYNKGCAEVLQMVKSIARSLMERDGITDFTSVKGL